MYSKNESLFYIFKITSLNYEEIIYQIINSDQEKLTANDIKKMKREFAKKNGMSSEPTNIALIKSYKEMIKDNKILPNFDVEKIIRKRSIRSQSWIVAVQVLTKPFACPWKCIFCPNDDTMPKSYIKSEPWAMRAWLNNFDPHKQVYNRLLSLSMTWHETDKIEMIVLWWTFDFYPQDYKIGFIKWLYDACNNFEKYLEQVEISDTQKYVYSIGKDFNEKYPENIEESIQINETAKNRIIWLTIETRPEFMTDKNCQFWRKLWITRIEMWVQSYFDDVLDANQRWHKIQDVQNASHKLRQYWFKFCIHIMPGLYKSTYEKDVETFEKIYSDIFIKPDEIKFYPTSVIPNTKLCELYQEWKYKPLETDEIKKLINHTFLEIIPSYTRIKRLIRDIPATEIVAGSNITNLSQIVQDTMRKIWKNNKKNIEMEKFYKRLYSDHTLFNNFEIFLDWLNTNSQLKKNENNELNNSDIETYIIWQEPNLKSFRDFVCLDTRSREVRNRTTDSHRFTQDFTDNKDNFVNLVIRKYLSSVGEEYFISYEDEMWYLYWFTRLLLPRPENTVEIDWLGKDTAIIRELHVYGKMEKIKSLKNENDWIQHKWFGWKLMEVAEKITERNWLKKMSVISGVWVREYYKHLNYKLEWTYMTKNII